MKHLFTGGDSPDECLEMNISSINNCKKNIPVNINDEAESAALVQIEQRRVKEAVNVLVKVSEKTEKKMLFPEIDQLLHVQFVYKKPGTTYTGQRIRRHFTAFIIPKGNTTICLIMRDLDQSAKAKCDADVDKQARLWAERLELEFGVTKDHVQKVLAEYDLSEFFVVKNIGALPEMHKMFTDFNKTTIGKEYHSYYDRRQLASAYDIFLVDAVVEKSVIRFCGKEFHKAKKIPLRVIIDPHRSLIKEIEKAYYTVTFLLFPFRTRTSLRIGNLRNPIDHIVGNVRAAVENVFRYCPGGLCNIHSVSLQMVTGGPSLPLYIDAGSRNAVKLPIKMTSLKAKRKEKAIIDELSTLPEGLEVLVHKDGEVEVLDSNTKEPVLYPTVNDEWEAQDDLKPIINSTKREELIERRRKVKEKKESTRS
ncbi:hypothetical protein DINM_022834 [Dirofilaria immitis]|nr:hypothetical protein [Dirofilaria immitis]